MEINLKIANLINVNWGKSLFIYKSVVSALLEIIERNHLYVVLEFLEIYRAGGAGSNPGPGENFLHKLTTYNLADSQSEKIIFNNYNY